MYRNALSFQILLTLVCQLVLNRTGPCLLLWGPVLASKLYKCVICVCSLGVCIWTSGFRQATWVCAARKRNIPASSSGQRKPKVLFFWGGMEPSASYLLGHGFTTELHPLVLKFHVLRLLTTSLHNKYQCLWWPAMQSKLSFSLSTPVLFITSHERYHGKLWQTASLLAEGHLWM